MISALQFRQDKEEKISNEQAERVGERRREGENEQSD